MTIDQYRAKLDEVKKAISACVTTGQEYSVVGSHSNKRVPLSELRSLKTYYERKIYTLRGFNVGRTTASFN